MMLSGFLNGEQVYRVTFMPTFAIKVRPDKKRQRLMEIDWIKTGDRCLILDNNTGIIIIEL